MNVSGRVLVLLVGALLAACGADTSGTGDTQTTLNGPTTTTTPAASESTVESTVPTNPEPLEPVSTTTALRVTGEVPQDIVDRILEDAAERAGVDVGDLSVVRDQQVEWPDGSLGCPEPGRMYTQAVVSGYWVEVEAPDEAYDYRVGGQGDFELCQPGLGG